MSNVRGLQEQYGGLKRLQSALGSRPGTAGTGGSVRDATDVAHDIFLRLKQEVRIMLEFRQSIDELKNRRLDLGGEKKNATITSDPLGDITAFEAEFKHDFTVQSEEFKQEMVRKLVEAKDRIFGELCGFVVDELGIDLVVEYKTREVTASLPEFKLWSRFFNVLLSFRSLTKFMKRTIVSKSESDLCMELAAKQLEIKDLQEDVAKKTATIKDLNYKLQQILVESGRNQVMSRQQDAILNLELANSKLNRQLADLTEQNRRLVADNGALRDEMVARNNQLDSLKQLYEANVEKFTPAVEGGIYQASVEQRELRNCRHEISMLQSKLAALEALTEKQGAELTSNASYFVETNRKMKLQEGIAANANAEALRQHHLKLAGVAAKLKFEALYRESEAKLSASIASNKKLQKEKSSLEEELLEMERYIDQLQGIIEQAEEATATSEKKYLQTFAELSAFQVSYRSLQDELTNGCTADDKQALEKTIAQQQDQIMRIQSQVRAANKRIFDLEDELSRK